METDKLSPSSLQKKKKKKPSTRPTGGAHLDPLVGSDAAHSDGGLRPVQQNLQLAALGVLAGADADGDHPAGTLLAWQTHTHTHQSEEATAGGTQASRSNATGLEFPDFFL